jgi:hypothetical protein
MDLQQRMAEAAAQAAAYQAGQTAVAVAEPELTQFEQRAQILIERGIPVAPLPPRTKAANTISWQTLATTDISKLMQLNPNPDGNTAAVARAEIGGFCFFEVDRANFHTEIEKQTGQKFPETFLVASAPGKGRGHFYLKHTAKSIALGNAQAKDEQGELWSFRSDRRYVVGPLSVKDDGTVYTIIKDVPVASVPDWLVEWIAANKSSDAKKTGHAELDDETPFAQGSRNNSLTSVLGKARQVLAMDKEQLYEYGLSVNRKRCVPPLPDSEVRTIANSVGGYEVKPAMPVIMSGRNLSEQPAQAAAAEPEIVIPKLNNSAWPVFPDWVMHGTSLYEGFVKPVCAVNSRIPYFMFLPTAALMMNFLGLKVQVTGKNFIPSFFMVLIGEKGRAIKSSSVEDAIDYLHTAGVMEQGGTATRLAEGKSLVWTAGSPEGLGLEMARTKCKNAVLFYDELSALVSKADIQSSALKSSLLTMYESGKFSNAVKGKKDSYSFDPKTYCASLIACTTDENFEDLWSSLAGKSSGLDDRFMFLLQPKQLNEVTPHQVVNTVLGAVETRKFIDKAVQQQTYSFEDTTALEAKIAVLGNRTEIRAEKWALYFAIDQGHDTITESDVERGIAVAEYEKAVKKYLGSPEADTKIAAAQLKYRRLLERKFDGRATVREIERAMNYTRYGTEGWWRIHEGLKRAGIIAETVADGKPSIYVKVALDE